MSANSAPLLDEDAQDFSKCCEACGARGSVYGRSLVGSHGWYCPAHLAGRVKEPGL